jgi:hypothetical protein
MIEHTFCPRFGTGGPEIRTTPPGGGRSCDGLTSSISETTPTTAQSEPSRSPCPQRRRCQFSFFSTIESAPSYYWPEAVAKSATSRVVVTSREQTLDTCAFSIKLRKGCHVSDHASLGRLGRSASVWLPLLSKTFVSRGRDHYDDRLTIALNAVLAGLFSLSEAKTPVLKLTMWFRKNIFLKTTLDSKLVPETTLNLQQICHV